MSPAVKVILATNDQKLDAYFKSRPGVEVVGEVYYREALGDAAKRLPAEAVVLSAYLPGSQDLADVTLRLRAADIRVVFLAGDLKRTDPLLPELVAQGVYDILFNDIRVEEIEERLKNPESFGQALRLLAVPAKPPASRVSALLKRMSLSRIPSGERQETAPDEPGTIKPSAGDLEAPEISAPAKAETPAETRRSPVITMPRIRLPSIPRPPREERPENKEVDYKLRPARPLVAVWSPVPAGKTFVAVGLADALSRMAGVALVDLDPQRSLHSWLFLSEGEDTLCRAMAGSLLEAPPEGLALTDRLQVYAADPKLPGCEVKLDRLGRLIAAAGGGAGVFLVDLPSHLSEGGREVLAVSAVVVFVADPDYAHCVTVREELSKLLSSGKNVVVVANRYADPVGAYYWNLSEVLGSAIDVTIPCLPEEAYGIPATGKLSKRPEFAREFQSLAERVFLKLRLVSHGKEAGLAELGDQADGQGHSQIQVIPAVGPAYR